MYEKNLTEDLRLRLSKTDMDFLRELSVKRNDSISSCIRSIIGEYRRSLQTLEAMSDFLKIAKSKEAGCPDGDTKTNFNDIV